MKINDAYVGLLDALELIASSHEELTDTDVREALHATLNQFFIWGRPRDPFPKTFRMPSAEGDRLVRDSILTFLKSADACLEREPRPIGQLRLDLLQSNKARTSAGRSYQEFLGYRQTPRPPDQLPPDLFSDGEY